LISIRLVKGRSEDELRALVRGVSDAAAKALDVPVERVGVHLFELEPGRVGRGGELLSDVQARAPANE
ncbi:MAG: 4-oxalocrotonate tautomerase, partial [Solirubrobacterales bacterium]|nr:4-oxalocrotonate tautomerase [Solirubrobacterales bacterium]